MRGSDGDDTIDRELMRHQVETRTEPATDLTDIRAQLVDARRRVGEAAREAGVVRGRQLTSWPSLQTDLRNAGATWVDEEVHVDEGLVSSRKPDDLPAFCAKLVEELAEGQHEGQRQSVAGSA